jgi:hypothetical protein
MTDFEKIQSVLLAFDSLVIVLVASVFFKLVKTFLLGGKTEEWYLGDVRPAARFKVGDPDFSDKDFVRVYSNEELGGRLHQPSPFHSGDHVMSKGNHKVKGVVTMAFDDGTIHLRDVTGVKLKPGQVPYFVGQHFMFNPRFKRRKF